MVGANLRSTQTWKPIVEKVEKKLNSWKLKILAKAGKLVLIKMYLNSLPLYYMSLFKMPNAVINKINSLQKQFFWGSLDGKNKMALVNWNLVQKPKQHGDLGVKDLRTRTWL